MPRMVFLHVWTSANLSRDFNFSRTLSMMYINWMSPLLSSPSPSEVVLRRVPRCDTRNICSIFLLRSGEQKASSIIIIKHGALGPYETAIDVPEWTWQYGHKPFADSKASSKVSASLAIDFWHQKLRQIRCQGTKIFEQETASAIHQPCWLFAYKQLAYHSNKNLEEVHMTTKKRTEGSCLAAQTNYSQA